MDLHSASREELIELVSTLLARVEQLEARVGELEEENRRLRAGQGGATPLAVKPSRPPKEKHPRRHRGRAFVRRREAHPDEVRTHALEHCPECGRTLRGGWEHARRQVIDAICQSWVTEHVLLGCWCGVCRKAWVPQVEASEYGVQGQRRFGASVQALVATLHIGCRLPMKRIPTLVRELCGLHLSEGTVVKLLDGLKRAGEAELVRLKARIRGAAAVCGDETGWRENGQNGYLWGFFTEQDRYFESRATRAGAAPEEILGENFGGVVTCDFYAGYNKVGVLSASGGLVPSAQGCQGTRRGARTAISSAIDWRRGFTHWVMDKACCRSYSMTGARVHATAWRGD